MWTGDILSRNVNLHTCWLSGHDVAISILSKSPTHPEDFDYAGIFSDQDIDMLHVFGAGVYPGITEGEEEDTSIQITPTPAEPHIPSITVTTNENSEIAPQSSQGEHSDKNLVLGLEEQLES